MSKIIMADRENKTVYRDGDKTIKEFATDYKKSYVMNEVYIQSIIEEHGMNVPHMLEMKQVDGKWTTVSEYIEGDTLDRLMDKNPEKFDEYLDRFVDIQVQFQTEKSTALRRLKDSLLHSIRKSDLPATKRYDMYVKLNAMPAHHHIICHGDYNPSNVIISEDGEAYILDWSHATQGNGSADCAKTYLMFKVAGHHNTAEKYLEIYAEKRGIDKEYIQKWIPIVAAAYSVECDGEAKKMLLEIAEG